MKEITAPNILYFIAKNELMKVDIINCVTVADKLYEAFIPFVEDRNLDKDLNLNEYVYMTLSKNCLFLSERELISWTNLFSSYFFWKL